VHSGRVVLLLLLLLLLLLSQQRCQLLTCCCQALQQTCGSDGSLEKAPGYVNACDQQLLMLTSLHQLIKPHG
jgi:hypothetical protein